MCKLAENTFRDVTIAYANELSRICEKLRIDVWELIALANRHPRVHILRPGAGVGGHCIAVDPWFLVASAPEEAHLIRAARETNDAKPAWVLERVRAAVARCEREIGKAPSVAVLGLAFKPDIDDLRESPAVGIAEALRGVHGEKLIIVEPHIRALPAALAGCRMMMFDAALAEADVVVVLVQHRAFANLAHVQLRRGAQIVDVVGLLADVRTHVAPLTTARVAAVAAE